MLSRLRLLDAADVYYSMPPLRYVYIRRRLPCRYATDDAYVYYACCLRHYYAMPCFFTAASPIDAAITVSPPADTTIFAILMLICRRR